MLFSFFLFAFTFLEKIELQRGITIRGEGGTGAGKLLCLVIACRRPARFTRPKGYFIYGEEGKEGDTSKRYLLLASDIAFELEEQKPKNDFVFNLQWTDRCFFTNK